MFKYYFLRNLSNSNSMYLPGASSQFKAETEISEEDTARKFHLKL